MKNGRIQKKISGLVLVTGLGLLMAASGATAQTMQTTGAPVPTSAVAPAPISDSVALTAVPPRLGDDYSLIVKPGETVQAVIEVRNPSDAPATVETFARDFIIGDDGETPIPVEADEANPRWALSQWLTLTPNNAVIKSRGASTILVTIDVPADALPGGRYAMVLHKPITTEGAMQSTGAQVTAQVGTLLYVIVDGELTEGATVDGFDFKDFSEMGPIGYNFSVKNDSSLHIRPEMEITVKNWFGQQSGNKITIEQKNIFPASSRAFEGQWDKTWGFGRYTATLSGTYGAAGKTITATDAFWIIPIRLILAVLLVIILITIVLVSNRKKYTRMLEAEEEKVRKLDEKLKKARRN